MTETEIKTLIENQRNFFHTGDTFPVKKRIEKLRKLKTAVLQHETEINEALKKDLGKSAFESYMCETGLVLSELTHMIHHVREYAERQDVPTPMAQFAAHSYKKPVPYGVVLIMSPWNYPLLLSLDPLIDAIAAGNTVILKPSAFSPATTEVVKAILAECFDPSYVAVVKGGREENTALLSERFDYIFFTGSQHVGREVMTKAAVHLTPVTLELGGKSPCIVDRRCNLKLAARRIVFGKLLNCGQTCVAPDYIYCDRKIRDKLVRQIIRQINRQYTTEPLKNPDYGKIINEKHFRRLLGLINKEKVAAGGNYNEETLQIEPTVLDNVTFEDAVMQEEIFGPLLPIVTYDSIDEAIEKINSMAHPLAVYVFTSRGRLANKVMERCDFGGGCINDTLVHLATSEMGFGGFGESGMGAYHGEEGFRTFTHYKSIVNKKTWPDLSIRYQPYTPKNEKKLRKFLK